MKLGMLLFFGALALVFVAGPILMIWSLNTLFALDIAYTLKTWFAAFILTTLFTVNVNTNRWKQNA